MSISKRVKTAFDFISKNDFENALIYISIVVDATSKKEYSKGISQSERNKKFIDDNQDFIYRFSTGGAVSITGTLNYPTGTLGRTLGRWGHRALGSPISKFRSSGYTHFLELFSK